MASLARFWRLVIYILSPVRWAEEAHGWGTLVPMLPGIGVVLGLIALAVTLLGQPVAIVAFVLGVPLIMSVLAGFKLLTKIERFEQKQPGLVFGDPNVTKVLIGPVESTIASAAVNTAIEMSGESSPQVQLGQRIHVKGEVFIGRSQVSNDPENRVPEAQVGDAVITITFITKDGKEAFKLDGRWTENEQPGTRPQLAPIDDIRRRDLIPNGEPNNIDVALKYEGDDCCYAFNDETCKYVEGWRDPKYTLPEAEYQVHVVLKGVALPESAEEWLVLRNLGKDRGIELERSTPLVPSKEGSRPR